MTRLLDDLPDLDSRLLLYAAGELGAEDAEAVERELATNVEARERLEVVRSLLAGTGDLLAAADSSAPLADRTRARASARAERAVTSWADAGREAMRLRPDLAPASHAAIWAYARWPLAAAAALVAGAVLFHVYVGEPVGQPGDLAQTSTTDAPAPTVPVAVADVQAVSERALQQAAAMFDSPAEALGDGVALVQLDLRNDLTDELAALQQLHPDNWE